MAEEKARDIIEQLSERAVCGSAILERLGHRAWSRPSVAVSARLYRQYRVPDPWDPNARRDETPIGLGPVSLRLGEKRRQPAPHLKPKPSKKEKKGLAERARAQHRPPRLPEPKKPPAAAAKPPDSPKTGTPLAAKQAAEAARAAEVAERMREAEAARGPRPVRRVSRADVAAASERPSIPIPVRPDLEQPSSVEEPTEHTESRSSRRSDAGRFRMPRAAVNKAPVVRSTSSKEASGSEKGAPSEPPPRRRAMPSVGGGGMDDLFGAAAQMGRVSLRGTPPPEEDEDE